ncbi:MAG: GDSL-type esterase/lipase family protein [Bacillota bacterium]|nr:GDSL-type esterase/lipase family protein [Bacillota bacterium]
MAERNYHENEKQGSVTRRPVRVGPLTAVAVPLLILAFLFRPTLPSVAAPDFAYFPPQPSSSVRASKWEPLATTTAAERETTESESTEPETSVADALLTLPSDSPVQPFEPTTIGMPPLEEEATTTPLPTPTPKPQAWLDRIVPENGERPLSYFDDALFIGDSRTEGLMLSQLIPSATYFTDIGISARHFFTKKIPFADGRELTMSQGLALRDFGKIYLCIGINDIGDPQDAFLNNYSRMVDFIRQEEPQALLYVVSILPVSQARDDEGNWVNNDNVWRFNDLLLEFCADHGLPYLDAAAAVSDEYGKLPADASADGLHLSHALLEKYVYFLRTHTLGD